MCCVYELCVCVVCMCCVYVLCVCVVCMCCVYVLCVCVVCMCCVCVVCMCCVYVLCVCVFVEVTSMSYFYLNLFNHQNTHHNTIPTGNLLELLFVMDLLSVAQYQSLLKTNDTRDNIVFSLYYEICVSALTTVGLTSQGFPIYWIVVNTHFSPG